MRAASNSPAGRKVFDTGLSLTLVLAAIILVVLALERRCSLAPSAFTLPTELQPIADAPIRGASDASVGVILYSDFACQYCRRFSAEVLPVIDEKYIDAGRILIAYRYLPSGRAGSVSLERAKAADCADAQSKFWQVHDLLFDLDLRLDRQGLSVPIGGTGVEMKAWNACMEQEVGSAIRADLASARRLRLRSTPFLLIGIVEGGHLRVVDHLDGLAPLEVLTKAIDAALQQAARSLDRRP